jgi:hypothetical protein
MASENYTREEDNFEDEELDETVSTKVGDIWPSIYSM